MKEIWKDIPDYVGYQISNLGRVRTYQKTTKTELHGIRHWKDRILKQKLTKNQKGRYDYRVILWKNGKSKTFLVSRLVAFTFYEKDISNNKMTVDHIDGNSLNNNLCNLEIVSLKENIKRSFEKDLHPKTTKKVRITIKKTNEIKEFISLSKASAFLNKANNYISIAMSRKIYENKVAKWELVK